MGSWVSHVIFVQEPALIADLQLHDCLIVGVSTGGLLCLRDFVFFVSEH